MSDPSTDEPARPRQHLSLIDAVCIILGIVIGAGIFETWPHIARHAGSGPMLVLAWVLGGVVSLIGAACYAELATTYPQDGGDYVYLRRAYGRPVALLFAWTAFWIVRPGGIGAMALIFGRYAARLWTPFVPDQRPTAFAIAAVVALTLANLIDFRAGKWTQNLLTAAKVLGLFAVVIAGFAISGLRNTTAVSPGLENFALAMILVLFTYGGWNEIAYVAAEVRQPRRNLFRALVLGVLAVLAVYLTVTVALLNAFGYHGVLEHADPAGLMMFVIAGRGGDIFLSLLICISCLGAVHGMILTGSRLFFAAGADHAAIRWVGRWNDRRGVPARSIVLQSAATVTLLLIFGTDRNSFEHLVVFTGPFFYFFLLLVGVAVFVLRRRDRDVERPYRVHGYPLTPLLLCAASGFMVCATTAYALQYEGYERVYTMIVLLSGVAFCLIRSGSKAAD